MKKLATMAAAAVLVAGFAGASASSGAPGQAAPERSPHVTRLVLHAIEAHSAGPDQFVGVDRLRSPKTDKIAGYDNFASVSNPDTKRVRFWMALSLQGGLIDTYFNVPQGVKSFTGRIAGGSGRYGGALGTLHVRISDSGRVVYTLRYTL